MSPAPCAEKIALLTTLHKAATAYLKLLSAQVAAGRCGSGLLYEDEIQAAREEREKAKRALEAHQRRHGC